MDISMKSLMCFKKVAELEHMTNAAKELYISQAQLSRTIAELEEEYGVKFFDRIGKGIKLNVCGREYYNYVQQVINIMGNAGKSVKRIHDNQKSQLTVISNLGTYMPELFSMLAENHPDLKFKQMTAPRNKVVKSLKEGAADFAIVCPMIDDPDILSYYLLRETGCVIYPEGHYLEGYSKVSLEMLADEMLVGPVAGYGVREVTDIAFKNFGITPQYAVETTETSLISSFVEKGFGVAIVHKSKFARDSYYKHRYCDIEEPMFGVVGISWLKDRIFSEDDMILYQTAIEFFGKLRRYAEIK